MSAQTAQRFKLYTEIQQKEHIFSPGCAVTERASTVQQVAPTSVVVFPCISQADHEADFGYSGEKTGNFNLLQQSTALQRTISPHSVSMLPYRLTGSLSYDSHPTTNFRSPKWPHTLGGHFHAQQFCDNTKREALVQPVWGKSEPSFPYSLQGFDFNSMPELPELPRANAGELLVQQSRDRLPAIHATVDVISNVTHTVDAVPQSLPSIGVQDASSEAKPTASASPVTPLVRKAQIDQLHRVNTPPRLTYLELLRDNQYELFHGLGSKCLWAKAKALSFLKLADKKAEEGTLDKLSDEQVALLTLQRRAAVDLVAAGKVRPRVKSEEERAALKYWLRGDPANYTPEAIAERKALKAAPQVRKVLEKWWTTITDGVQFMHGMLREEYLNLNVVIHRALVPDATEAEAFGCATDDWLHDSKGRIEMTKEDVLSALFDVADVWTEDVSAEEYSNFLSYLLEGVTQMRAIRVGSAKPGGHGAAADDGQQQSTNRSRSASFTQERKGSGRNQKEGVPQTSSPPQYYAKAVGVEPEAPGAPHRTLKMLPQESIRCLAWRLTMGCRVRKKQKMLEQQELEQSKEPTAHVQPADQPSPAEQPPVASRRKLGSESSDLRRSRSRSKTRAVSDNDEEKGKEELQPMNPVWQYNKMFSESLNGPLEYISDPYIDRKDPVSGHPAMKQQEAERTKKDEHKAREGSKAGKAEGGDGANKGGNTKPSQARRSKRASQVAQQEQGQKEKQAAKSSVMMYDLSAIKDDQMYFVYQPQNGNTGHDGNEYSQDTYGFAPIVYDYPIAFQDTKPSAAADPVAKAKSKADLVKARARSVKAKKDTWKGEIESQEDSAKYRAGPMHKIGSTSISSYGLHGLGGTRLPCIDPKMARAPQR